MVSSFILEDKLNDVANFKGMHLYMLFMLYYSAKHEEAPSSRSQAIALRRSYSDSCNLGVDDSIKWRGR